MNKLKKILKIFTFAIGIFLFAATTTYAYSVVSGFSWSLSVNSLTKAFSETYTSNDDYTWVRVNVTDTANGDNYDLKITNTSGVVISQVKGLSTGEKYVIDFASEKINYCRTDSTHTAVCDSSVNSTSYDYCLLEGENIRVLINNGSLFGGKITVTGNTQFQN